MKCWQSPGKKLLAPRADSRITFIEADAQDLPVPSDAFQIVCVAFGLRNVADTDRGLAEMTRACAPDGHVAVLEFSTPTWQPFKAIYGWYFRHVLPRIGKIFVRDSATLTSTYPPASASFRRAKRSPTVCALPASPKSVAIRSLSAWLHFM